MTARYDAEESSFSGRGGWGGIRRQVAQEAQHAPRKVRGCCVPGLGWAKPPPPPLKRQREGAARRREHGRGLEDVPLGKRQRVGAGGWGERGGAPIKAETVYALQGEPTASARRATRSPSPSRASEESRVGGRDERAMSAGRGGRGERDVSSSQGPTPIHMGKDGQHVGRLTSLAVSLQLALGPCPIFQKTLM